MTADAPHPSGKPWIDRSAIEQMSQDELAERSEELLEAVTEGRIRNDR